MTPHIGLAEELLTWALLFVIFIGVAWLVAQAILHSAKEYPYDDDL